MPQGPRRGVVFDLDGTLVVSRPPIGRMQEAIRSHAMALGVPVSEFPVHETSTTSGTLLAAREAIQRRSTDRSAVEGFEVAVARDLERIEMTGVDSVAIREGALPLLESLRERGCTLAVFTRASRAYCDRVFSRFGLGGLLDVIRTRDDPGPAKPSSGALQAVLSAMKVRPTEALYVGDHPEDAVCARSLGVPFWAVLADPASPPGAPADEFTALGAERVARDLLELRALLAVTPGSGPPSESPGRVHRI
jgi:phosphoglycolate phosphatase